MSPARLKEKLYRDPAHDLIALDANSREDRALIALIDTPEFQRLRRIRQLGLAFTAFHGAEHSRFVHSVGVMWLVTRILDRFERVYGIDRGQVFPARCAALLHDVGHGPFSHVLEHLFEKRHDRWTREIVCAPDSEVNHVLCSYDLALPSAVVAVLDHRCEPPFAAELIASQLDADRFDYLIRDSLMTGAKHGVFDLERLVALLRLDDARRRIVVAHKAVLPVEKYLQSRYHMFRQVYQHKTVKAAEAMLVALLRRAMDLAAAGEKLAVPPASPFGRFLRKRGKIALDDFLALDDATLQHHWSVWEDHPDHTLSDLSRRLLRRELFKTIEVNPADPDFEARLEETRALVRRHGFDPDYYVLRLEASDIPYRPFEDGTEARQAPILVESEREGAPPRDLLELSPVAAALARVSYSQTRLAFPEARGTADLRAEIVRLFAPD